MKFTKKIILSILSIFIVSLSLTPFSLASDYDSVSPPSILPSAYQDAQVNLARKDASKENAEEGKKENANKDAEETKANLNENISKIMSVGNFGIVGTLFGPTSAVGTDNYANIQNTMSLDVAGIKSLDSTTGGGNKAMAYWQFGRALSTLQNDSVNKSTFGLSVDEAANSITKTASKLTLLGVSIIKDYNPTPLIYAIFDSSYLSNDRFAGEKGNKLIKLVNENEFIRGYFKLLGDPVYMGVSLSMFLAFVIGFTALILSGVMKVWNGKGGAQTFRRMLVRIAIVGIGLPVLGYAFSNAIAFTYEQLENNTKKSESTVLRQNLNLVDWYQNTAFGLPNGYSISVKNGKFLFDESTIYAINKFSARNIVSSDGSGDFGYGGKLHKELENEASREDRALIERMRSVASRNGNISSVSFRHTYGQDALQGSFGGSTPWDTGKLISIADSLSKNKKISDKVDVHSIQYLQGSLDASGNGDTFTYTMRGTGYGISPMAAYNMMATDFNNNGFTVKSNTSQPTTVAVAMDATNKIAGSKIETAPSILKIIVTISLLFASMSAMLKILFSGFGMLGRGSVSAAFGSANGFGMLVGSLIAFSLGMIGISVIATILLSLIDTVYSFVSSFGLDGELGLTGIMKDITDNIPKWLSWLSPLFNAVGTLFLNILMIYFLPKLMKIPVQMYADFIGSIGDNLSNRFARWEDRFTSSYGSRDGSYGGTSLAGGSFSDRSKEILGKDKVLSDAKTFGVGSAMLAGAGLSKIGQMMTGESISDVVNKDNSENNTDLKELQDINDVDDVNANDETQLEEINANDVNSFDEVNTDLGESEQDVISNDTVLNETPISEEFESFTNENNSNNEDVDNKLDSNVVESTKFGDEKGIISTNIDDRDNETIKQGDVSETIGVKNQDDFKNNDVTNADFKAISEEPSISEIVNNETKTGETSSSSASINGESSVREPMEQKTTGNISNVVKETPLVSDNVSTVKEPTSDISSDKKDFKSTAGVVAASTGIASKAKDGISNKVRDVKSVANGKVNKAKDLVTGKTTNVHGKEMSKLRHATGRMLQNMGSYASGDKQGRKQALAGLAMMGGALAGKPERVQKHAQNVIDRQNERLVKHGHTINSTLSADPTRKSNTGNKIDDKIAINEETRKRMEKRQEFNSVKPVSNNNYKPKSGNNVKSKETINKVKNNTTLVPKKYDKNYK